MNKKQLVVMWLGIIALGLLCVFPPTYLGLAPAIVGG